MASSAQPKIKDPKEPRKSVSVRQRWRAKTNYEPKRFTGFAPISFAMVAEVGRLTAGKATQLLYVILTASLGQIVKKEQPFKELAADLKTCDLAELCACDDRTIQRELTDLKHRKVIGWEQSQKGVNVVTPLFRSWDKLPDYKPAPVLEPAAESDDEPLPDDPAQADKQTTYLTKSPVYVKAGAKSKRTKVDCGVAWFETEVRGKLDAEYSAVVQDGVLRVIIEGKWDGKSLKNELLQQKGLDEKPRQGCRGDSSQTEGKRTKGERGTKGENAAVKHPRAEELSSLFDPLIHRWCGKTLSGDSQALLQACIAIGDTPHDVLVKAGVGRGSRTLTPLHVVAVCREIEHNWRKGGELPVSKGAKKQTFAERLKEKAIENIQKHGRIA